MVMTNSLSERISSQLLPHVTQPAQYLGREINQLVHDGDWQRAEVKIALAFPDHYTIGMSHLGCQIIYWLANHIPGVCAERCYTPALDAEQLMRREKIPLFTWDTRQPVSSADIFAVSLQYEMVFTNLLTMLDLAAIPRHARQRDDSHPLILAGGPQADNPEPLAPFLDLVVIGDAEDSLPAIIELYKQARDGGVRRREIIAIMAKRFPWIYAPNLYDVDYHRDGTISRLRPTVPGLPAQIERCHTADFENAPFPLRPLVPNTQIVQDRACIEIMRGCPQRCRFCHAGHTKRPIGVRSVEKILQIAEEQLRSTGQTELGLLSLSTADYPHLEELAAKIHQRFGPRHVNISMPSLRVDKILQDIPWLVAGVRKAGLTIAVEAASDRLRTAIRKKTTDGNLMDGVMEAYRAGWRRIKCYFMVGFPGETEEDIAKIYELSREMALARKKLGKPPANITASIGWLVPKPHTPLQWAAQPRVEYFQEARTILDHQYRHGRTRAVRIKTHDPQRSILEAVLARGDRRLAAVVEAAYLLGARFDAWNEHFDFAIWQRAFQETGIAPDWYAHRERAPAEIFPWDHIRSGPPRDYLRRQYDDFLGQLQLRPENVEHRKC